MSETASVEADGSLNDDIERVRSLLDICQQRLNYRFHNPELLESALTHASGAVHRLGSNERMEFLGDSVLGLVVCHLLYRNYPEYLEGELTKIKSIVVSRETCAKMSRSMGMEEFLIMGKGMMSCPDLPPSLLANVFESLVASIFLDGGFEAAVEFVERLVSPEIELAVAGQSGSNFKSQLQQLAQREFGSTPAYFLVDEKGPDHSKAFKISAQVAGKRYPPAWGRNKKIAEQRAAANTLAAIRGDRAPFPCEERSEL